VFQEVRDLRKKVARIKTIARERASWSERAVLSPPQKEAVAKTKKGQAARKGAR